MVTGRCVVRRSTTNIVLYLNAFYISWSICIIKFTFAWRCVQRPKYVLLKICAYVFILNTVCHEGTAFEHATLFCLSCWFFNNADSWQRLYHNLDLCVICIKTVLSPSFLSYPIYSLPSSCHMLYMIFPFHFGV